LLQRLVIRHGLTAADVGFGQVQYDLNWTTRPTQQEAGMESANKIRLGALLAATAVTAGLAASLGPAANGIDHLLHHWFASLSPQGQAIARAIGSSLPYWLPGTMTALVLVLTMRRRPPREDADDVADRHGNR